MSGLPRLARRRIADAIETLAIRHRRIARAREAVDFLFGEIGQRWLDAAGVDVAALREIVDEYAHSPEALRVIAGEVRSFAGVARICPVSPGASGVLWSGSPIRRRVAFPSFVGPTGNELDHDPTVSEGARAPGSA